MLLTAMCHLRHGPHVHFEALDLSVNIQFIMRLQVRVRSVTGGNDASARRSNLGWDLSQECARSQSGRSDRARWRVLSVAASIVTTNALLAHGMRLSRERRRKRGLNLVSKRVTGWKLRTAIDGAPGNRRWFYGSRLAAGGVVSRGFGPNCPQLNLQAVGPTSAAVSVFN
jgi:hypothetical protein